MGNSNIYISSHASKLISKIDSMIFDCDGVLVDVSKSYDLAIKYATQFVLKKFENIKSIPVSRKIICGFKETGGFNDEVDVTYAAILSLAAAKKIDANPEKFIFNVIRHADQTGIASVEKYLERLKIDIGDLKKKLDYPGPRMTNPLCTIFDQIFYGPKLYFKIFGKKSTFKNKGLIENDRLLVSQKLVDTLRQRYRIAIVTGRGKASTEYSLGKLLGQFDLRSSVFLEDMPRYMAKPNPKSLISSFDKLGSKCCLYVGDSMEDLIMANKANKAGCKVVFCAIYGSSPQPGSKKRFFIKNKAPIILKSIKLIPKALNLAN